MTKAYDRMKEGLSEALSVAKGEQPVASITVNGHTYVPKAELDEALRRYDKRNRTAQDRAVSNGLKLARIAELEAERDQAIDHLGDVLNFFAELSDDDRCDVFVAALDFYNSRRPDAQVVREEGFERFIMDYGPLQSALGLPKPRELESELAACKIALDQARESNRERQAEIERLIQKVESHRLIQKKYKNSRDNARYGARAVDQGLRHWRAKAEELAAENERLVRNAQTDAWILAGYHRICERHGIAPSSAELMAAADEVESE